MSDKHSTPNARKASDFKLSDTEKLDIRDGIQAWAGILRSRAAQERLTARMLEKAEHPDHEKAQECHARGLREEESADRLDQLAAKVDAFVAIPSETSA